jgi:hypothetical protein
VIVIVISAVSGLIVLAAGIVVYKKNLSPFKKVHPSINRAMTMRNIATHNGRLSIVISAVNNSEDGGNAGDKLEYTLDERFKMICSPEDLYHKHRSKLKKIKIWQVSQLFLCVATIGICPC